MATVESSPFAPYSNHSVHCTHGTERSEARAAVTRDGSTSGGSPRGMSRVLWIRELWGGNAGLWCTSRLERRCTAAVSLY